MVSEIVGVLESILTIMYLVKIIANIPYPKTIDYRIKAGNIGTAVARAYRQFRKDNPRKVFKELSFRALKI